MKNSTLYDFSHLSSTSGTSQPTFQSTWCLPITTTTIGLFTYRIFLEYHVVVRVLENTPQLQLLPHTPEIRKLEPIRQILLLNRVSVPSPSILQNLQSSFCHLSPRAGPMDPWLTCSSPSSSRCSPRANVCKDRRAQVELGGSHSPAAEDTPSLVSPSASSLSLSSPSQRTSQPCSPLSTFGTSLWDVVGWATPCQENAMVSLSFSI